MSLKSFFAELVHHRDDPLDKFQKLSAVGELSKRPDIVAQIEPFLLPEVIKLICCSQELLQLDWAIQYQLVQPLYSGKITDPIKVIQYLENHASSEAKILKYIDIQTLTSLAGYASLYEKEKEALKNRLPAQKGKLTKYRKKEDADPVNISAQEEEIKAEEKRLRKIESFLNDHREIIASIRQFKKDYDQHAVEKRREDAYHRLERIERAQTIRDVVNELSTNEDVSPALAAKFKDHEFLAGFLLYFSKEENKQNTIPILLKLYDIGAIDINEPPTYDFIAEKSDLLLDYLLGIVPETVNDMESEELNALVDIALRLEYERGTKSSRAMFYSFWNQLQNEFDWKWLCAKVDSLYPEHFEEVVGYILRGLNGKASRTCVHILFDSNVLGRKFSAADIFSKILSQSDFCEKESVVNAFQLLEKRNRSTQLKLKLSERQLRCQSQDVFSSMYIPLETLEGLAIDLSFTSGQIEAKLVGKQLREVVAELRDALGTTCGVIPVADIEGWKKLEKVPFDAAHHKFGKKIKQTPREVLVKNLGFSYIDDEGNQKEYPAQVITVPSTLSGEYSHRTHTKKQSRRGKHLPRTTMTNKSKKIIRNGKNHKGSK